MEIEPKVGVDTLLQVGALLQHYGISYTHLINGFCTQLRMLMEMILGVGGQREILENVVAFVKFSQQL